MDTIILIITLCSFFFSYPTMTDAKPEIITSATDVMVGQEQLLLCKAGKEAEIEWIKDGEEVDQDHFVVDGDETTSTLTVKRAQLKDSGTYTCKCIYESGPVSTSLEIFVYDPPNFGRTSQYHEFLVNTMAHIPCMVSGKPEVEINWYRKNSRVYNHDSSNIQILSDRSLQITNIQRENHGTYTCEGKIKGRPISKNLNISVVVNVPPTVRVHTERMHVVAGPDATVSINCLVTGVPHPNITWTGPSTSDSSRYVYNSDKSTLTIPAVTKNDFGQYVCTAVNKIGEDSATIELDVSVRPTVMLSQKTLAVNLGESASVFCNATGHPQPKLEWIMKSSGKAVPSSGRLRVKGSQLVLEKVEPSDGGVYSCKATNAVGSTAEDFGLITSPAVPTSFSVSAGSASAHITLKAAVADGGSPITQYIIQFRKQAEDDWKETVISFSDALTVKALDPYTQYSVRFAAKNKHFLGGYSEEKLIYTLDKREPDAPVPSVNDSKIERNSYTIPIKQLFDGGSPITHYVVRYRLDTQDKEDETWTEKEMDGSSDSLHLTDLEYNSDYQVEISAVNINGMSTAARFSFSIPEAPKGLGRGGVVGIIITVFLLLLVAVDAFCCYTNQCGLLNFLRRKLYGQQMSKSKSVEDGVINNAAVDMKGLENPRGSLPKQQSQNGRTNGVQSEVVRDTAPLTKFEKAPAKENPITKA